jgi:putative phosphoribosyl transferase
MAAIFENRTDAGRQLAHAVERFRGDSTVVLGIPRGGVPVARRVADALDAPLDIVRIRKPGPPLWASGPPLDLTGKRAIIIDDGVATGETARAACRIVRNLGAAEIVLAVPVAPSDWTTVLAGEADVFVAVATPRPFWSVGQWYTIFEQTTDEEVEACFAAPTMSPSARTPILATRAYSSNEQADSVNSTPAGGPMTANSDLELR